LKECATNGPLWLDKTTQADGYFRYIDKTTQTDLVFMATEEVAAEYHNSQAEKETATLLSTPSDQCFEPLSVKTEPQTLDAAYEEPIQGVPIPVYVSGMITTDVRSTDYFPFNGMEPISYYEINQEYVPNVNTNNLFQCPIVSNESAVSLNQNGSKTETYMSEMDTNEEEPYVWSVIEEQTSLNVRGSVASNKALLTVRRLSDLQQNENLPNGTVCDDEIGNSDQKECSYMNIDERISSLLRGEANNCSSGELLQHGETVIEDAREPSVWTVEKCHHQKLLHAKVFQTCFDVRKRGRMRLRFLELFGSDSEDCFEDEHATNFKEKIAHWVVESLMPYYRDGRIQSRPLFKFLARHIADTLFLKNRVPGRQSY
jgi:hypothetical protein